MSVSLYGQDNDQRQAAVNNSIDNSRSAGPEEKPLAVRIALCAALLAALILFFILGLRFGGWLGERSANTARIVYEEALPLLDLFNC